MSKTEEAEDAFTAYQKNLDRYCSYVEESIPKYIQSTTDVQQEYFRACSNATKSSLTLQKDYVDKTGLNPGIPKVSMKFMQDITDGLIKVRSTRDQIALATIDTTKQNIKTWNDNLKSFADLNKNIMQSWILPFISSPRTN